MLYAIFNPQEKFSMSDVLSAPRLRRAPTRPEPELHPTSHSLLRLDVSDPACGVDPEPSIAEPTGLAGRIALVALRAGVLAFVAASAVAFGMALSHGLILLAGLDV